MSKISSAGGLDPAISASFLQQNRSAGQADNLSKQKAKSDKEIEKAASGFEALLLQQMLKSMWATVQETDVMGDDSNAAGIYRDMLNERIADTVSKGRGIGVKDMLIKEMKKQTA